MPALRRGAGDGLEGVRMDPSMLLDPRVRRQIQPVVGARLPLNEIGRAHRMLERVDVAGKIELVPS